MSEARHLTVKLDPASEPIAGRLSLDGGPASRFVGYLQLIARLEKLRSGTDPSGPAGSAGRSQDRAFSGDASSQGHPK